jgi:hypothetical protein
MPEARTSMHGGPGESRFPDRAQGLPGLRRNLTLDEEAGPLLMGADFRAYLCRSTRTSLYRPPATRAGFAPLGPARAFGVHRFAVANRQPQWFEYMTGAGYTRWVRRRPSGRRQGNEQERLSTSQESTTTATPWTAWTVSVQKRRGACIRATATASLRG